MAGDASMSFGAVTQAILATPAVEVSFIWKDGSGNQVVERDFNDRIYQFVGTIEPAQGIALERRGPPGYRGGVNSTMGSVAAPTAPTSTARTAFPDGRSTGSTRSLPAWSWTGGPCSAPVSQIPGFGSSNRRP